RTRVQRTKERARDSATSLSVRVLRYPRRRPNATRGPALADLRSCYPARDVRFGSSLPEVCRRGRAACHGWSPSPAVRLIRRSVHHAPGTQSLAANLAQQSLRALQSREEQAITHRIQGESKRAETIRSP